MRKINFLFLLLFCFSGSILFAQEVKFDEKDRKKVNDDDPCSLNAGEDQVLCANISMFNLIGSINNGEFVDLEWEQTGGPDVDIEMPNSLITPVSPLAPSTTFVDDVYEFTLSGTCIFKGEEIKVSQTVQITLLGDPEIDITHQGGVQTAGNSYVACRRIEFIANNGLLPGETGVWNVEPDNVDELTIVIDPATPHQIGLSINNPWNLCGEPFSISYTLTNEGGCTSTDTFVVTFTGGREDDFTTPTSPPPTPIVFCDQTFWFNPIYPGCPQFVDIVDVTLTGPGGTATEQYFANNIFRILMENLAPGTHTLTIQTTNEFCGDLDLTYILEVFPEYELGSPLGNTQWFCDGQVPDQSFDISSSVPPGTNTICWIVNTVPDAPSIEGEFCGNETNHTFDLQNVPPNTYVSLSVEVSSDDCEDRDNLHLGVINNFELIETQENLDCGDDVYFVVFDDYLNDDMLYGYNSIYYDFVVEAVDFPAGFDFQWGDLDSDGNPDLLLDQFTGFAATDVGTYVFELSSTNTNAAATDCNVTQIFTVIVGPGGALANAGTDFPPACVTEVELVGNPPLTPDVQVEWSQITTHSATFSATNVPNPTVTNLTQGEIYVFEYTIFIPGNPDCRSTDQVVLDNTNCGECPVSFGPMGCEEFEDSDGNKCRRYTITMIGEDDATNVNVVLSNLPDNGFNCAASAINGAPINSCPFPNDPLELQFVDQTTWNWNLPNVSAGEVFTIDLVYCWAEEVEPVVSVPECDIETSFDCTTIVDPPTCFDGIQNQGETGVDCGGPCPACECPIAFENFTSELFENGDGAPCVRYTLVVDGLASDNNVVIQVGNMPANGFTCASLNGTPINNCSFPDPTLQFVNQTTWNWVIPTVNPGDVFTLEIEYCWAATTPDGVATHSSAGCDIMITSMMMLQSPNDDKASQMNNQNQGTDLVNTQKVKSETNATNLEDTPNLNLTQKEVTPELNFFPNPTDDKLFLVNGKSSSQVIELFTLDGRRLQEINLDSLSKKTISLDSFGEGMYLMKITDQLSNEVRLEKLVIIK